MILYSGLYIEKLFTHTDDDTHNNVCVYIYIYICIVLRYWHTFALLLTHT